MNKKDKIRREAIQKLSAMTATKVAARLAKMQPLTPGAGQIFTQRPLLEPWSEWRRTTSLCPRKSINGKIIIGRINKRSRPDYRPTMTGTQRKPRVKEFATDKELFKGKLKGDA